MLYDDLLCDPTTPSHIEIYAVYGDNPGGNMDTGLQQCIDAVVDNAECISETGRKVFTYREANGLCSCESMDNCANNVQYWTAASFYNKVYEVDAGYCVNQDCAGYWSDCTSACELGTARTWIETVAQEGTGNACPDAADAVDCADNEDDCAYPTCAGYSSCVTGFTIKADLTGTCASSTCQDSDCCDANPTCADGYSSCGTGFTVKNPLPTDACASSACVDSECCDANPTCADTNGDMNGDNIKNVVDVIILIEEIINSE
jgi:hypothetical protein